MTIHVTVASVEHSFSKLNLLQNYLSSTMKQERLNALTMIVLESDMLEKIDYGHSRSGLRTQLNQ